jgi:vacuolar-type H+-ATPase subunit F/Vma7
VRTGKVPTHKFCEKLLNAFIERNPEIGPYMNSDKGIKFMNTDSRVSDKIIDHFVQQDIPILCVHDSYIVPDQYEDELREQMTEAFKAIIKVSNPHIEKEEQKPYTITEGYRRRWEEFQQWKKKRS